jgi:hypothetical protein
VPPAILLRLAGSLGGLPSDTDLALLQTIALNPLYDKRSSQHPFL